MVQLSMGYPNEESEAAIIMQHGRDDGWQAFGSVVSASELLSWSALVDEISIHPDIISYIVACVRRTREHSDVLVGASPRTGVKLSRLARALSMVRGEDFVTLDLVKEIMVPAVAHRLVMKDSSMPTVPVIEQILDTVPVEQGSLSRSGAR
jgi:MoxR-like ATPase